MLRIGSCRLVLGLVLFGLLACFSDRPTTGPTADTRDVRIANFAFVPPDITVPVGATVTWTNDDATVHTVTSDDGTTFDSNAFRQGMTFQFTPAQAGTYTYVCTIHPFMKGKLMVTP